MFVRKGYTRFMITQNYLYPKLRGRIIEKYQTYGLFADSIGYYRTVVSRKLSGNLGMTKQDIEVWSKALDIDYPEIGEYFFKPEVN